MNDQKENIFIKKDKSNCFHNHIDEKFVAYKIQKNPFLRMSSNFCQNDTIDYQTFTTHLQNVYLNSKLRQNQKQQGEKPENLCDLWDEIGNQCQASTKQSIELTEEQLRQCFEDKPPKPQSNDFDQDLMKIWADDQIQLANQKAQSPTLTNNRQFTLMSLPNSKKSDGQKCNLQIKLEKFGNQSFQLQKQSHSFEHSDPNIINVNSIAAKQNKKSQVFGPKSQQSFHKTENVISTNNPSDSVISNLQRETFDSEKSKSKVSIENVEFQQQKKKHQPSILLEIKAENNHKNMKKLISGLDYHIFNTKLFAISPFEEGTYSYFGIQTRNRSLLDKIIIRPCKDTNQQEVFYLFCFETKEALLQLKPQPLLKSKGDHFQTQITLSRMGQKKMKSLIDYETDICYKIRLCQTKQHIATLFYRQTKNCFMFDLKLFDEYEDVHSEFISLIQVKDSFINKCCYCDTNVFIEKKSLNQKLSKLSVDSPEKSPCIQKLKMILNMKNGRLTASMGINGIQSSPYNSCLENQSTKKFVYLLGLLPQSQSQLMQQARKSDLMLNKSQKASIQSNQVKKQISSKNILTNEQARRDRFILKIGEGVSPLIGLAVAASRKLYIDRFE